MLRTGILAALLYGYYATGHIAFLLGAFGFTHLVQESIISIIKDKVGGKK
jgi:hypothetical protein